MDRFYCKPLEILRSYKLMIKKSLLYTTPLLFLLTLLVLYQWSVYTYGDQEAETPLSSHKANIRVLHDGDRIYVEQSIEAIKEGTYTVRIPEGIGSLECFYEEGQTCLLESSPETVTVSSNKELHFTYELPFQEEGFASSDWFIQLARNDSPLPMDMNVSITEKQPDSWIWISSAVKEAKIKKDHIDFYQWEEKKVTHFPLYSLGAEGYSEYQKGPITFYSKNSLPEHTLNKIQNIYEQLSEEPLVVVVGDKSKASDQGVLHVSSLKEHSFKKAWYHWMITAGASVLDEMNWLIDSLVAYFANTSSDTEKGKKIKAALTGQLTEVEKEEFLMLLSKKDKIQTPLYFDQTLGKVKGLETSFFQENISFGKPFVPLYFYETKEILLNNDPVKVNWRPIKIKSERFYPLGGLATLTNMEVTAIPSENVYIVRKEDNTWRFSLNQRTFIENEESFGIASEVLIGVNKDVYMKERYIKEILGISVREDDQSLHLIE